MKLWKKNCGSTRTQLITPEVFWEALCVSGGTTLMCKNTKGRVKDIFPPLWLLSELESVSWINEAFYLISTRLHMHIYELNRVLDETWWGSTVVQNSAVVLSALWAITLSVSGKACSCSRLEDAFDSGVYRIEISSKTHEVRWFIYYL